MTFTVRGYNKEGELMVEECGVEDIALDYMLDELRGEGFDVEVVVE